MSEQDYEQLTLFPADSHVSHSVWLVSKKAKGTTVTSGLRCSELSESCARIASSVRTYLESSRLPPGRWQRIWSALDITSSCSIMKLRLSERGTDEAGSSLWATPNTMDSMDCRSYEAMKRQATTGGRKGRSRPSNLREQVNPLMCQAYEDASAEAKLWPTPCAMDAATERMKSTQQKGYGRHSLNLPAAVRLYPTPRANEYKDTLQSVPPSRQKEPGKCNLTQAIALEKLYTTPCAADSQGSTGGGNHRSLRTDVAGQLNPTWVVWLMGFPIGWTDLNA